MVDYGVVLVTDSRTERALRNAAGNDRTAITALNQDLYSPLRSHLLAISIETKIATSTWDEAQVQVSGWAAAQFKALLLLVEKVWPGRSVVLPTLPFIIVHAHDWYLLMATREGNETVSLLP